MSPTFRGGPVGVLSALPERGAIDWYDTQAIQRTSMEELLAEFTQFFCPTDLDRVMDRETVFTRVQERTENNNNNNKQICIAP